MDSPALNPPILFISDVHLGAFSDVENSRIESELIRLINYCQRNNIRIAILGDLFDYWMEYPDHVPDLGKRLLNRFEEYNDSMGPTLFITGNHDNWTRNHLPERGFYLEHEYYIFSSGDHRIMLMHGDGLSDPQQKLERPLMHRILRNEQFIKYYQTILPPRVGISLMKNFSQLNRKLHGNTEEPEKLNHWTKHKLENSDLDVILCGHDHVPRTKQFSFGTYLNLGSFYKDRTMAFYNNEAITLVSWEGTIQSLNQFENKIIDE